MPLCPMIFVRSVQANAQRSQRRWNDADSKFVGSLLIPCNRAGGRWTEFAVDRPQIKATCFQCFLKLAENLGRQARFA